MTERSIVMNERLQQCKCKQLHLDLKLNHLPKKLSVV